MMATDSVHNDNLFPWGYFIAALLPIGLMGAMFVLPALLTPQDWMWPTALCLLLIGPIGVLVSGWGLFRLWRGEGQRFPALRWLVWLSALVGVTGFVLALG
jgi:hypothetical protein